PASPTSVSTRAAAGASARTAACVGKRFLQDLEAFVQLVVRYYERGEDADDVAVETAGEEDEAAGTGRGDDAPGEVAGRLPRRAIRHQLEAEHGPEPADLSHAGRARGDLLDAGAQAPADRFGPFAELGPSNLVEHGERGRARERVAAERPTEAARRDRVHHLGAPGDAGERQAAAERLPGDDQVGLDAVVLDRPDGARAAHARLDLVVDVEDPVAPAQLVQPGREVRRHRDEAALALHGFEAGDGGVGVDAAVRVRPGSPVDLAGEGAEAALVDDLARHREREQRPPVEGVL